jgi:hypothetical protein
MERNGGFMKHHRRAADERRDFLVAADIGALEVDSRADLFEISLVPGEKVVDDDDLAGARGNERADDLRADEPGSSRDDVVAHEIFAMTDLRDPSDSAAMRSPP